MASGPAAASDGGGGGNEGGPACTSASEAAYLFDGNGVIYTYDPPSGKVTPRGTPDCGNGNVPWTATFGLTNAYIIYTDWSLYQVDLLTLQCTPTAFAPGQLGLDSEFGFAVSSTTGTERMFFYGYPTGSATPLLAVSDLTTFQLTKVADVALPPSQARVAVNLTSDSQGHLYAYSPLGVLQQIDESTGAILATADTGVTTMSSWANLTYGGEVYLIADSRAVGYDLPARTQLSTKELGIFPCGGGTSRSCQ